MAAGLSKSLAFRNVAIVGTGFIGTSLGLALKQLSPAPHVTGFDLNGNSVRLASRLGAVNRVARDLAEAVREAELVVIATPVRAVRLVLEEVGTLLPSGAVVTDTGSTKKHIVAWASELLPGSVTFVGGHPMTGPLTTASDQPDAGVFQGAVYCLTPTAGSPPDAVKRLVSLVESIGAVPYFVDAEEHDGLVAGVSHLPYLMAAALMNSLAGASSWTEMQHLAAGNLVFSTSPATGDPQMYADICLTNRDHILRRLGGLQEELARLARMLSDGDESIVESFRQARQRRQDWLAGRSADQSITKSDLRPQGLFIPPGLGDILRGKRPDQG